ncbi:hypothetical protein KIN20_008739 [Parelaphostrongylus tenuis]|uniref:Uncharacterized protein n=1 Tax=Parelaphostrongylus tenuis TaxID=148309 RepID=A0AAD5MQU2_PARTN|nr:hypothetical protein KIN20_008739 [Parelaphostrongylus tenuis]
MLAFTVSGFSLPVNMVWTSQETEALQFPGISRSAMEVQAFVQRLTMQAVFNVLEEQGRRAGLFPAVISGILDQLTVRSNYSALQCDKIHANPMNADRLMRLCLDILLNFVSRNDRCMKLLITVHASKRLKKLNSVRKRLCSANSHGGPS